MSEFIFSGDAVVDAKLKRAQSLVGSSPNRPDHDWYPTPPEATQALLKVESFEGSMLEPACGDGAISTLLLAAAHQVVSTDLVYRGFGETTSYDYTSEVYPYTADNVITNPPFTLAEQFIRLSLARTTKKVAVLCKLQFLEGAKRKLMFESTPFKKVWVFSKRLTLTRNGEKMDNGGMIAFGWYVWDHAYKGEPTVGWL